MTSLCKLSKEWWLLLFVAGCVGEQRDEWLDDEVQNEFTCNLFGDNFQVGTLEVHQWGECWYLLTLWRTAAGSLSP